MTPLIIGAVYEHVKTGNHYRLLVVAKDSKSLEDIVVYEALYDNKISKKWVRTKESFVGTAVNTDGTMHPRFVLVENVSVNGKNLKNG